MALSERQFHERIDAVQQRIEDFFDQTDLDVDVENSAGILTLGFPNKSQVILSRQPALQELWIAARSGGFHLIYQEQEEQWFCPSTQESLEMLLKRVIHEHSGAWLNPQLS